MNENESAKKPVISLPPAVVEALRKGQKIEAIKRLREAKGVGLAEAKAILDALASGRPVSSAPSHRSGAKPPKAHGPAPSLHRGPGLSPGEVPRSGSEAGVLVLVLVAAAAGFLLWWFA
jgi:hypothetical protein